MQLAASEVISVCGAKSTDR